MLSRGSKALLAGLALAVLPGTSFAADLLKLAIGQRGLWDSSIAEVGMGAGIFQYLTQPLTPQQIGELLQLPGRRR